jgi:hypothetical protein
MERKRKFKNLSTMTNLPTHLTDKIETGAQEWATSGSLKEWIDTGMNDTRYSSTLKTFLAGASFLYSLLKEEKGEVGRWVKCSDALPEKRIRVLTWDGLIVWEAYVDFDGEWKWTNRDEMMGGTEHITHWIPLPPKPRETPVVAGCGELVSALKKIAYTIDFLREEARKEGGTLDGQAAIQISQDVAFLKGIAIEALKKIGYERA